MYSHAALALVLALPIVAGAEDALTFHISDFGVNQHWSRDLRVGQDFVAADPAHPDKSFHNRAFPALDARPGAQILIPMPTDAELANRSATEISKEIVSELMRRID